MAGVIEYGVLFHRLSSFDTLIIHNDSMSVTVEKDIS